MYQYNPKSHIKIWLSSNPDVFINLENQIRLIEMREKNPNDAIQLVYDSTLLTQSSIQGLYEFARENHITLCDAHTLSNELQCDRERQLYSFYKEELSNLYTGGNLAVASDILRWLSPIFTQGTYTDFDVPVDTTHISSLITINSPLLLNIGSLKLGRKEFILANTDFVAIVDPVAAKPEIERVQKGLVAKLAFYDTDFIERTEQELIKDSFINRYILKLMKNRSESLYISKTKEIISPNRLHSSLKIRSYIHEVMKDPLNFLNFKKLDPNETHQEVLLRLRKELKSQLNITKYLFFSKEYSLIKQTLAANDIDFLNYLMKKEHDLYLKSIVICTTGPIQIANALFNGYVVDSEQFKKEIQPVSFNYYGLQQAFHSRNSIPLHENILGMLKFLGVEDGTLNDSSWLNIGNKLQASRIRELEARQKELRLSVPYSLSIIKNNLEAYMKNANINTNKENSEHNHDIALIYNCFQEDEFNVRQFKWLLGNIKQHQKNEYTEQLIKDIDSLCHDAIIFGLTKNKKLKLTPNINRAPA